jgi:hypothetical protein
LRARRLTDAEIIALYASGLDSLTVGIQAGCDANTVLNIVRAAGGTVRPSGGRKPLAKSLIPIEEAARLYDSGLSVHEVADRAGIDHATMRQRLIRFGVRLRSLKDVAVMKRLQGKKWGRPRKEKP